MNTKTVRIMIVDDDRDLAESLADLLKVFGYEVTVATMGRPVAAASTSAFGSPSR